MTAKLLTTGELARQTGVALETIRYYERIGLLTSPPRTSGGHRVYDEGHALRLVFIRRGRELGFSLNDIRELLGISDREGPVCGHVLQVAVPHLEAVRRKIADLTQLEAMLGKAVAGCTGQLAASECPVLEMFTDEGAADRA